MFSNEGLGGGGQRAQRGGSMAGTVGREIPKYFSHKAGMGMGMGISSDPKLSGKLLLCRNLCQYGFPCSMD